MRPVFPCAMIDYEVFVLSRNRPAMLTAALRAILDAGCPPERITVSDNSTDECIRPLEAVFPGIRFIYRRPPLELLEHSNTLIRSARAEYFFMLHDDDLVLKDFFVDSLDLIVRHPGVGAASLNAVYLRDDRITGELCSDVHFGERVYTDGVAYLRTSFELYSTYFAFPGYVYRTTRVAATGAHMRGAGKYSDIAFLTDLAHRSGIAQRSDPGMAYRQHAGQGSAVVSIARYKQLLVWAKHQGIDIMDDTEVTLCRLRNAWWLLRARGWSRWRERMRRGFILTLLASPRHYGYAVQSCLRKLRRR
jgi:hypothetical protein